MASLQGGNMSRDNWWIRYKSVPNSETFYVLWRGWLIDTLDNVLTVKWNDEIDEIMQFCVKVSSSPPIQRPFISLNSFQSDNLH